jgi:hypothetical protein
MGTNVINLTAGPGDFYIGNFGATEPADSAVGTPPASATWTDLGGTTDGVKLAISQSYFEMEVDQIVDIPGRRLTKREVEIETSLAEPTLENLVYALNAGTVTASATFKTFESPTDTSATQPTYRAVLFDGWAPGATPFRRRIILRKVLSIEGVKEMAYKKDGQTLLPVKFSGHYVSTSIKPYKIIDQLS